MERQTVKVRLIKAGLSPPEQKDQQPPDEAPVGDDIVHSWVDEFKLNRAIRRRLDLLRMSSPEKK
jgi:hypothetical protein